MLSERLVGKNNTHQINVAILQELEKKWGTICNRKKGEKVITLTINQFEEKTEEHEKVELKKLSEARLKRVREN